MTKASRQAELLELAKYAAKVGTSFFAGSPCAPTNAIELHDGGDPMPPDPPVTTTVQHRTIGGKGVVARIK